jgi:mRNA interferase MazF
MVINQGDVYWIQQTTESDIPHPYVIMQENNPTLIACALTSNLKRVAIPGNVLLAAGEANLPRQSVVEVAKVVTVMPAQLGEYIGSLSEQRLQQLFAGMRFQQVSFFKEHGS